MAVTLILALLADQEKRRKVVLELFAGAGGSAFGVQKALGEGPDTVLVERDENAAKTARKAGFNVIGSDVRAVDYRPYLGRTILLWTSPPCQPFSSAGSREGPLDDRNGYPMTLDVIDAVKPTWLIAENVTGLLEHKKGHGPTCAGCYIEQQILPALRERFAFVTQAIVDASDFGLPQARRRAFFWGGPRIVEVPTGTGPKKSLGEAIPYLKEEGEEANRAGKPTRSRTGEIVYPKGWGLAQSRPWLLDQPSATVAATEVKGTNYRESGAGPTGGPPRASDSAFLAAGRRRLTPAECALLQGFPVNYPWQGSVEDIYRQIGNAVPPILAEVVARATL